MDISYQIRLFDFGVIGGLGYKLTKEGPGMSFGIKYYYGLFNIFKHNIESVNSSLYIYAQIPIGSGKSKK